MGVFVFEEPELLESILKETLKQLYLKVYRIKGIQ